MSPQDSVQIDVFGPMSNEDMKTLVASDEFNRPFDKYTDHYYKQFTDPLTPEQKAEVEAWWKGNIQNDFWGTVSKPAYNAIMSLISFGLG